MGLKHRYLIAGDLHAPWARPSLLAKVIELAKHLKPTRIIQIGDLLDLFSFSRFARSQNLLTPKQETEQGRNMAAKLWRELQKACPKAECYGLRGNHDERFQKRMLMACPEFEHLIDKSLWHFDGVQTQPEERQELILEDIVFMHGFRRHGDHVRFNLQSTVVGHSHLGGVVYHRQRDKTLFELNAGYLADPTSLPLSYTQQAKFSRWTHGVGFIGPFGPQFIPL